MNMYLALSVLLLGLGNTLGSPWQQNPFYMPQPRGGPPQQYPPRGPPAPQPLGPDREGEAQIKCTLDAPCYNTMLNIVMDGKQDFDPDSFGFLKHYALVGLDRVGAAKIARKALKWFEEEYGLVFVMDDNEVVQGNYRKSSIDGKASIFAYRTAPESRYRVYTAKVGDRIQLMNAPISIGGWTVDFTQDYVSTGRRNITIPRSGLVVYGYYIIQPCVNQPKGSCQNIINPENPTDNTMVQYEVDSYFQFHQGIGFSTLHATVRSDLLGVGQARGYFPMRDPKKMMVNGWQDMVFSPHAYPYREY